MQALAAIVFLPIVTALVGYDCGGEGLNITTLSLLDIGTCEMSDLEPNKEEVYVQLMQLSDYDRTNAIQCKVEIDRTIYYCGMHSHVSVVNNGRREYILEIGDQSCRRLQETGTITISNTIVDQVNRNATTLRSLTLAGRVNSDGRCAGAQYSDVFGSWENVIVQAVVRITLRTFEASIKRTIGHIMLPSGTQCQVTKGNCLDSDGMETFWNIIPSDSCHFDQYDVLYEGLAVKLTPRANQSAPVVYTVTAQETTFALAKTTEMKLCGYSLTQTEHPKLFILETQRGHTFRARSRISVDNLDIFSYVNSKFVYVEKHIKTQLTQLYRDIMEQKCALERQILQNALSLASIAPDEMAFRIMKNPGYTAVTLGEVIHLIKCVPVECKVRYTEQCYNELPVTHRNSSYFLLPRSRILARTGTPRECSGVLPAMYRIEGTWFRMTPRPLEAISPPVIQPLTRPAWQYVSPSALASSGIYSNDDLDRLRTHIMFPVEKQPLLNTLARGAMGERIPPGTITLSNFLDEDSLNRIAESAGAKVWKGFMTFGSASAGVLAIILIIRLAKLIIDTIIHGYALHSVYGWSLHLLGAIWSSVTHLLLHLAGRRSNDTETEAAKDPLPMPHSPTENQLPAPGVYVGDNNKTDYSYRALRSYIREEAQGNTQATL